MVKVNHNSNDNNQLEIPKELLKGKRHLTKEEIAILEENMNQNEDASWSNFYVDASKDGFNPKLISLSFFSGYIILGKLDKGMMNYNDLHLSCGIYRSKMRDVIVGYDFAIHNVAYLENYHIGNRVILFNVNEICCTKHAKFGNGILKKGEPENHRIWIGVGNENDGRRILPFEDLIPADAYIWSHYRNDEELLNRFIELTERGNTGELDTYGIIDDDVVIKHTGIVKDAKIGKAVYIKGAQKLKNITILSSEEEPSQVGEGVEMVNGILGYGSHIFYQAMAIRFVIGRNCHVKYGARLLNSVLGDNSTVSCCEILNNLIFPFHEQHHNSSFLIATTVMGQSNIASGATIGSNHNSRSADGEIFAKRGFWPGLCSDFKHNSRFASFDLISKGSYQYELDIPYPFALVAPAQAGEYTIHVIPAWWYLYDMFAITRNKAKFIKRDKRVVKVQNIETDPLAPDTMQEVMVAVDRLICLTRDYLKKEKIGAFAKEREVHLEYQEAKDYLHKNIDNEFQLFDETCQKKYGAIIYKPVHAYKMYRKIVKYFATRTLMEFCKSVNTEYLSLDLIERIRKLPLYTEWENVGGQIIPSAKIQELFAAIKNGSITDWNSVHQFYNLCECSYEQYKVRYALYLLEQLYSRPIEEFSADLYQNIIDDVTIVANDIYSSSCKSREKDYTDYYRTMMYRDSKEMNAVLGAFDNNEFLKNLEMETKVFVENISVIFQGLTKK